DLTWTDASDNEQGFGIESCSGAGCTTFAVKGTVAADVATFADSNLTASTPYTYRVHAFNATDTSAYSNTTTATTLAVATAASPVLVGAGEITSCASVNAMATARVVDSLLADSNVAAFTVGNNLSDTSAGASFAACFDPSWGRFKSRTFYAVGTMDFESVGEEAVYNYFGDRLPSRDGWYSYDLGTWHIVVLNTTTWQHGAGNLTNPASPQNLWLAADLAATDKRCIMAISWERRLYTTEGGDLGRNFNANEAAKLLYAAGADVLVSAKDKIYARFPLSNPDGAPDEAQGFRQFIVGTGGRSFDRMHDPAGANPSTVEVQQVGTWGVVKFTLDSASYSWQFIPAAGGSFTDSGTTNCH
ncbi:MAG: metallophosphoesterase family protein, partial [Gemmatimonadales bacterium]